MIKHKTGSNPATVVWSQDLLSKENLFLKYKSNIITKRESVKDQNYEKKKEEAIEYIKDRVEKKLINPKIIPQTLRPLYFEKWENNPYENFIN
jgi:hypothetical protein